MNARGFTLIEVIVAVALSMLVILAVYAGIRTTVRSIATVERLTIENQMLAFSTLAAVERADRWDDLDDPSGVGFDPDKRPLRTVPIKPYRIPADDGSNTRGGPVRPGEVTYDSRGRDWDRIPQPFTPLADSWRQVNAGDPPYPARDYAPWPYDPDDWLPHVPKSWYRGDHAWYGPDHFVDQSAFGNYALCQAAAKWVQTVNAPSDNATLRTTHLAPWRRWLPDHQIALSYGLGWYGWFDYLPANALVDAYTVAGNGRALKPAELRRPRTHGAQANAALLRGSAPDGNRGTAPSWISGPDGGFHGVFSVQRSHVRAYRYTTGVGQAVTKGWQTWGLPVGISAAEPAINRAMAGLYSGHGYYSHSYESLSTLPMLITSLADGRAMVQDNRDDWPDITIDVRRFTHWGSPRTQCYVRFTDPISGESSELFFPLTSATLRGARLARDLDRRPPVVAP